MMYSERDVTYLVKLIDSLEEPYRKNTISWLERYIQRPMEDLPEDIGSFLIELDPVQRRYFLNHVRRLLKTAVHYFGLEKQNLHTSNGGGAGKPYRMSSRVG
jgi:hypothetical protein